MSSAASSTWERSSELENDGGVSAIILDRWTADGVTDSRGQAAKAQNDPAC